MVDMVRLCQFCLSCDTGFFSMAIAVDALWHYDPNHRATYGKRIDSIQRLSLFRLSKSNANVLPKLIEEKKELGAFFTGF